MKHQILLHKTKNHDAADVVDSDELGEMVDVEKQDDLGKTGASISSTNGKLQLEVKRISLSNTDVGAAGNQNPGEPTERAIL